MERFSFGDYQLNITNTELLYNGEVLPLEPQVYCILELLITRHGHVVSRDEIIKDVWGGRLISKHVLDNRIRAARAAIGDTDRVKRYIKTYPNRGYKFVGEVTILDGNALLPDQKNCEQLTIQKAESLISTSVKSKSFIKYILGPVLSLCLGIFIFQSSVGLKGKENASTSAISEPSEQRDFARPVENTNLPRIAILPFETIGENSEYSFLPDILESEFNQIITVIEGLTVVSFYSKTASQDQLFEYQNLREEFDLDYVIASELSYYDEMFKLNVSLVRTADNGVLGNEIYDLDISNAADPIEFFGKIAPKITLMTANKLGLSLGSLPNSWKDYSFYAKIKQAELMTEVADYESVKKASALLREAIDEEPNYILPYLKLINSLSWEINFLMGDYESLIKEQAELALKMQEISPSAPETLIISAFMGYVNDDGIYRLAVGEGSQPDPLDVSKHVLAKDHDNIEAMLNIAYMSEFVESQADTVAAYADVLELAPTDSWILPNYSYALFCNADFSKSREIINRASKWHQNHRYVLGSQIKQASATADYKTALLNIRKLLDKGVIAQEEYWPLITLFDDLGHVELALEHIRFPPERAYVYAKMGERDAALKSAAAIEKFHISFLAEMIAKDNYYPEDYFPNYTYEKVGEPGNITRANMCRLDNLARDTYVFSKLGSDRSDDFLALLVDYFENKDPKSLKVRQEYTSLMALHILQGDHEKAIEVMDIAMERGFLFIGSFKEPFLRDLTTHPGFPERLEKMKRSADRLIAEHYTQ